MTTLYDELLSSGNHYFDNLNSSPLAGTQPAISAVGTLRFQGSAVITGVRFGSSQGAGFVTIGGVSQPVQAWSATSITIGPIARGTLKYGNQNVIVTTSVDGASNPTSQPLLPQTGWNYVNLVNPLATSGARITATPDLAGGDQLAYGDVSPSGTVTVAADASFVATTTVGQFAVEINDGTAWGGFAIQSLANVAAFSGSVFSGSAHFGGSFQVTVPSPPINVRPFSGTLRTGASTLSGSFLTFTSKAFDGVLAAGRSALQGAFNVIGAVVLPTPPATAPLGTGTPAGKVAVVNRALVKLGAKPIKSFLDPAKGAQLASGGYDRIVDEELARHFWKFALFRKSLADVVTTQDMGGYRYAYEKPVDWLETVWIGDITLGTPSGFGAASKADWSHEGDVILTNVTPPLPLQYIRRITDPTRYHVLFVDALACRLAMEWCEAITSSMSKYDKARLEYRDAIADARRANAILDPPRGDSSDSWLDARL